MKTIVTFNVGSSTIKYSVFEGDKQLVHKTLDRVFTTQERRQALKSILNEIKSYSVNGVAHRVVHGGTISSTQKVTPVLLRKLKKISDLAPLHNLPEVEVIEECIKRYKVPQVAVFDTAFHQSMPLKAAVYGLPFKYFKKGIRRYGFHGTSHKFVSRGLKGKVITCHLGNGCSITAILNGKSIDTSMGFTPLEGLVMGTRAGSFDPAIIPYLMENEKVQMHELNRLLNKESGLLGISGLSNDLRDLLKSKKPQAKLAVEVFVYRIIKQIGAYVAALNGVDSIVFTAGITQNNATIRKMILDGLTYLGVRIDTKKNKANARVISAKNSKVKVLVIPTNEELAMAQEARKILS